MTRNLSGESEINEKIPDEKQDLENKVLSGSSDGCEESTDMIWRRAQSPAQPLRRMMIPETQEWTPIQTGTRVRDPKLSELAIHTLLVETRARDLDREVYQDPHSDRNLIPSERVFDNAADDLETIAYRNAR